VIKIYERKKQDLKGLSLFTNLEIYFDYSIKNGHKKKILTNCQYLFYDPYGIRTRVTAVKGRCLNRLTKGPNWRRRRDLNPRTACAIYTLSRGASSAT
jgi:hypothetical protein